MGYGKNVKLLTDKYFLKNGWLGVENRKMRPVPVVSVFLFEVDSKRNTAESEVFADPSLEEAFVGFIYH
jgi:hypothetical protein